MTVFCTDPLVGRDAPQVEKRRHERYRVRIDVSLKRGEAVQSARLNDLSAGGAGLTGAIGMSAGEHVIVEMADGRRLSGTVVWHMSGCSGIEFDRPMAADDPLLEAAANGSLDDPAATRSY